MTKSLLVLIALVGVSCASVIVPREVKWKPHPTCSYNVSVTNANIDSSKLVGQWYFDSVESKRPLDGVTCLDYKLAFKGANGVGTMSALLHVVEGAVNAIIDCAMTNTAAAKSDYEGTCFQHGIPGINGIETRYATTDYTSYALVYSCFQDRDHQWKNSVAFLSRSKQGLSASQRQMLLDLMGQYGWNVNNIRRVKSQSAC